MNYAWNGGNTATAPPVDSALWQLNQGNHNGVPHQEAGQHALSGGQQPKQRQLVHLEDITTPGIPAVIEHTYTLHIDEFTCPDPGPEVCPQGTDHAGEAIPADKTRRSSATTPW